MSEISKLRQRLSNIGKNVTEYRMTVKEAQLLINEIDILLKPKEKLPIVAINEPTIINRTIDGGAF